MPPHTELDQAVVFERLQNVLNELYGQVTDRLTLFPNSNQPFQSFSSPDGNVTGSLLTFTGEKIDKLVYSQINAAPMKFGVMRLLIWLNSQIQVPHLVFEFGTIPAPLFYMDYVPRVDLWTDLSYTKQYYEAIDSAYLELRNNPDFSLYVSKGLYIRQAQSPAHLCFTCSGTEANLSIIQRIAHEMCSRWLTWVDKATPVAIEAQPALAERDLTLRRTVAEQDPDNAIADRIFGTEFASQLVRSLWCPESNASNASSKQVFE